MSIQPLRAYTDPQGQNWLALTNGHKIKLPAGGSGGGGVVGPTGPQGPMGPAGPQGPPGEGGGGTTGSVTAGSGLSGGGTLPATINVGQGAQLSVAADTVALAPYCTTITNWNSAITNGWYMANGAANSPAGLGGWWYGIVIAHNSVWCHQIAFPFANSYEQSLIYMRSYANGVWNTWFRPTSYPNSYGTIDNMHYFGHGGDYNSGPVRRWALGMDKDKNTAAASANDEFQLNCYDTAGNFTWIAQLVLQTGKVSFPKGHSLLRAARETQEATPADTAATVGIVADMILSALTKLDLLKEPIEAGELVGMMLAEPEPFDDGTGDDEEEG